MKLYNTLTRQVEELAPLNPPTVTIYTCGPTVYDYAHIGHWFTYIRWDTLIRTLRASGYQPKWVMNITDVGHLVSDADEGEDKLEKGARREGKTAWEVAKFYTDDFVECMQLLNILTPDEMPKATDHIAEQIELIKKLEAKGYTYRISDGVYYDTSKFEGYAAFARLDLDDQIAGARVEINPEKRNPSDFALWKFSPPDSQRDMEWDSPWGKGFPGWHIECSAMSMKYLDETLDIHTGGIDHIPVHHTNEIAQSEPVTGKRFANLWMHANHILINDQKISKSLGNGIRLQEIVGNEYSPEVVRLLVLESHYRSQSKFSWASLQSAKNRLKGVRAFADLRFQPITAGDYHVSELDYAEYGKIIVSKMQDDLNTPEALKILNDIVERRHDSIPEDELGEFNRFLELVDALLGLKLLRSTDITHEQKGLIAGRETARKAQDWAKSDQLRDQLAKQGIEVRDTPHGPIWSRAG